MEQKKKWNQTDTGALMVFFGLLLTVVVGFAFHWAAGLFVLAFWLIVVGVANAMG